MESESNCYSVNKKCSYYRSCQKIVMAINIASIILRLFGVSYIIAIEYIAFFGIVLCIIEKNYPFINCKWEQYDLTNEETIKKVYPLLYHWTNSFFDYLRYITTDQTAFYQVSFSILYITYYQSLIVLVVIIQVNEYISSWSILTISLNLYALYYSDTEKAKEMKSFICNISECSINVVVDSIPKYEEESN